MAAWRMTQYSNGSSSSSQVDKRERRQWWDWMCVIEWRTLWNYLCCCSVVYGRERPWQWNIIICWWLGRRFVSRHFSGVCYNRRWRLLSPESWRITIEVQWGRILLAMQIMVVGIWDERRRSSLVLMPHWFIGLGVGRDERRVNDIQRQRQFHYF